MNEFNLSQLLTQAGLAGLIFIVWYITFTKIGATLQEAFTKYDMLTEKLLKLLQEEQTYKEQLVGVLTRLEIELKTNSRCPLAFKKDERIEK